MLPYLSVHSLCHCMCTLFPQQSVAGSWRKLWQLSITPSLRRLWVLQRDWEISTAKWAAIPKLWKPITHRQEDIILLLLLYIYIFYLFKYKC